MAEVEIRIAGRAYALACRDGGEGHLRRIAALVDAKAGEAARSMGGLSEARNLLLAALLLADELDELRSRAEKAPPPPPPAATDPSAAIALERLADRLEALADQAEAAKA